MKKLNKKRKLRAKNLIEAGLIISSIVILKKYTYV